jgi:hypothetical protein
MATLYVLPYAIINAYLTRKPYSFLLTTITALKTDL